MTDALQKEADSVLKRHWDGFSIQMHLLTQPLRVRGTGVQCHDPSPVPVEAWMDMPLRPDHRPAYDADAFRA